MMPHSWRRDFLVCLAMTLCLASCTRAAVRTGERCRLLGTCPSRQHPCLSRPHCCRGYKLALPCILAADTDDGAAVTGAPMPGQGTAPEPAPLAAAPDSEPSMEPRVQAEAFSMQPGATKLSRLPQRRQAPLPPASPYRRPGPGPVNRKISISDLRPTKGHAYNRDFYYQARCMRGTVVSFQLVQPAGMTAPAGSCMLGALHSWHV